MCFVAGQVARTDGDVHAGLSAAEKQRVSAQRAREVAGQVGFGPATLAWNQTFVTGDLRAAAATAVGAWGPAPPAGILVAVPHLNSAAFEAEVTAMAAKDGSREEAPGDAVDDDLGRPAGVRVGRQVFLSGHLSVDVDGTPIDGPFEAHFARALDRLLATAARLGAAPDDIVWLQYLTPETPSVEVFRGAVSAAHRKRFPGPNRPATSLIGVAGLVVDGAQVEVTGLAVLPP
jgi:enamine deaminase RidA (YjgF/YER057c/UK114 family)